MIVSFRSRALKRYWERSETEKLPPASVDRIRMILDRLDAATAPGDLDLPGLGFHALKGDRKGQFAVFVTRNWRITFCWDDGDAIDVNLEDYH
ncbi:MAG TPA: type II toxin-antitoxin system RelE/ParE family toxin [Methyloceanibacter sp.]|jgi:proteic killer suppression protein|nr:type II toxin-antitoxin system RelE/ParE family toxin [Methyloceanibacter sp.]